MGLMIFITMKIYKCCENFQNAVSENVRQACQKITNKNLRGVSF